MPFSTATLNALYNNIDTDGNGEIDGDEWAEWVAPIDTATLLRELGCGASGDMGEEASSVEGRTVVNLSKYEMLPCLADFKSARSMCLSEVSWRWISSARTRVPDACARTRWTLATLALMNCCPLCS